MTSFDQFVNTITHAYVRYADDFVIWCEDESTANNCLERITQHLYTKLKLKLNDPHIGAITKGFEFLGLTFSNTKITISEPKKQELTKRMQCIEVIDGELSEKYLESLSGIEKHYISVLPVQEQNELKEILFTAISKWIKNQENISYKNITAIFKGIPLLECLDKDYKRTLKEIYNSSHGADKEKDLNKQLIRSRKLEYQRRENDNSELIIASQGYFIGVSNRGITLRKNGTQMPVPPSSALKHITILSDGVTISSNAIDYCMDKGIPIDFFDRSNRHIASIISPKYLHTSNWNMQNNLPTEQKIHIAQKIIEGKLKNQMNLIKYFHKYHKAVQSLEEHFIQAEIKFKKILLKIKEMQKDEKTYKETLMTYEAQGALLYWDYIKMLIADDNVGFEYRIQHGATDIVNSMLNYGYSIIYPRVWQSILRHKLNPYIGLIHYQEGNPNLVFDIIELFRSQAVDRIVVSMIQKKERLVLKDGRLDDETRSLLTKNIYERLNRYEKYRGIQYRLIDIVDLQVKEIINYMSKKETYRPYIAKW